MKSVFTLLHIAHIHYIAYFICLIILIKFPSSCVPAVVGGNIVLKANIASRLILSHNRSQICITCTRKKKYTGILHYILKNKSAKMKKNIEIHWNICKYYYSFVKFQEYTHCICPAYINTTHTFNVFLRGNLNTGLNSPSLFGLGGLGFCFVLHFLNSISCRIIGVKYIGRSLNRR